MAGRAISRDGTDNMIATMLLAVGAVHPLAGHSLGSVPIARHYPVRDFSAVVFHGSVKRGHAGKLQAGLRRQDQKALLLATLWLVACVPSVLSVYYLVGLLWNFILQQSSVQHLCKLAAG